MISLSEIIPQILWMFFSILMLWFTTLAVLEKKKILPFLPFFLNSSLYCFIVANYFIGLDTSSFLIILTPMTFLIAIIYLISLWRENGLG
jgi:hypothetical protein